MEQQNSKVKKTDGMPKVGSISYAIVDLCDLETVKPCVDAILEKTSVVDYLVLNAGVMATPYRKTKQNLELQIGGCRGRDGLRLQYGAGLPQRCMTKGWSLSCASVGM